MELRKVFDQFDRGNDGVISFEEFEAAMKESNYLKEQMQEIFESIVSDSFLGGCPYWTCTLRLAKQS
jgi:Ca2+-binding EF-hand superfamily protein